MAKRSNVQKEGLRIVETLRNSLRDYWDGRECILELREADYQWRQMEWIGWYFEYVGLSILVNELGGSEGPAYGRTTFDYINNFVWDLKSHAKRHSKRDWAILNDAEAVRLCIEERGAVGFVVASGSAVYDDNEGSFYNWHEDLKGGPSDYTKKRKKRGAPSRRRKRGFNLESYEVLILETIERIETGLDEGWLGGFQKDFRNADGSLRRSKIKVELNSAPTMSLAVD